MKTLSKLLIFLIFFANIAVSEQTGAEPINKADGVVTNVLSTFYFYESYEALWADWPDYEGEIKAICMCERKLEENIAWCDIYLVEPVVVDGDHTMSLGHEVEHGVFGENFHVE